jgi:ATP-dependent DNA helicase RecG
MITDPETLNQWLLQRENERLECKEAKASYSFDKLVRYCAALANEGGGTMVLGVTDQPPRRVVGTQAFPAHERTVAQLVERFRIKIECEETHHSDRRLLIFHVPSHPPGLPLEVDGAYWMRAGDELRPMTADQLRRLLSQSDPTEDFTARIAHQSQISDLDPTMITRFRSMWRRKSGNQALETTSDLQLLQDAELVSNGQPTLACVILMGTQAALGRQLPQAEVVFEYRVSESSVVHQQRLELRRGLLGILTSSGPPSSCGMKLYSTRKASSMLRSAHSMKQSYGKRS